MAVIYRNEHSYAGPISMLAKLADGELVIVFREARWRGFVTHGDPTTRASLLRSGDGGRSWHSLVTPDPAGGNGASIAALADGTLLVNTFHWRFLPLERAAELPTASRREIPRLGLAMALDGVYIARSHTGGYTWSAPARLELPGVHSLTTAGRVVELTDGGLLLPLNLRRAEGVSVLPAVARSRDGGETWELLAVMGEDAGRDYHETRIALLPDGRLLALHRTADGPFYRSLSADGGARWTPPAPTPLPCEGSSPADLLVLADGRLLCTYGRRRSPFGVRAAFTTDGGDSWTPEVVLRDDAPDGDMGYPSTVQRDDGALLTACYWHGEDGIRYLEEMTWEA